MIRRKILRPLRQAVDHVLPQRLDPLVLQRRHRQRFRETVQLAVLVHQRQQIVLRLHRVDLVQNQNHRRPVRPQHAQRALVFFGKGLRRVHHIDQQVALLQRSAHRVHHAFINGRIGLMNTRRVDEDHLRLVGGHHALNSRARRLRLIRDDRYLLPHQRVQKCGLAGIRPAENRNETGAMDHSCSPSAPCPSACAPACTTLLRRTCSTRISSLAMTSARMPSRSIASPGLGTRPSHSITRPPFSLTRTQTP